MGRNGFKETTNNQEQLQQRRVQFLVLLSKHIQTFQRSLILRRRKRQQILQKRRAKLREFYLLSFLELESRLLEMAPLIGINDMLNDENNIWEDDEIPPKLTPIKPLKLKRKRDSLRFYEDVVSTFSEEKFFETFRMSRKTFQLLCDQLRDTLQPSGVNAPLKTLISLETRCALSLYAFATGSDYRVIASLFRISRTSVCKFTKKFAEALLEKLGPYLLGMPRNEEEYKEIRENFKDISGMPPLCVGLLGACEIHVSPQLGEAESYANGAGATTLVLQGLVDDKRLFRKVHMEAQRPAMLLTAPNEITKLGVRQFKERFLPCFVMAPSECYTLQPWLMQAYKNPKAKHELNFNKAVNKLQLIKKEAFQRLFARWKILQRKGDLEPRTMILIASACCALHNLLEEYEEKYDEKWTEDIDMSHFDELTHCKEIVAISEAIKLEAKEMRNVLAHGISGSKF